MSFYYIITGIISGIVAGMGMGGGTLLIPILVIAFNMAQQMAQGINLLVFIPMSIVTLIIHTKNKLVDFKIGIPIVIAGVGFSILGSFLATKISSEMLKKFFGWFLLIVGIWQIIDFIMTIISETKKQKSSLIIKKVFEFFALNKNKKTTLKSTMPKLQKKYKFRFIIK